jgi:hypothetical protein
MIYFNLLHENNNTLNSVTLNTQVMIKLFGCINVVWKLLDFLTTHEVIHKTGNYTMGIHSNYYQFKKNHINNYSFEKYKITNLKLIKRIKIIEKNKTKNKNIRDKKNKKKLENNIDKIKKNNQRKKKFYQLKYPSFNQVSISKSTSIINN